MLVFSSIIATSTTNLALAQGEEEEAPQMRALLEGRGTGGYGGPEFGIGVLGGRIASRVGGRAGWVATRNIVLGGFGEGISSNTEAGDPVRIVDGGLFLEVQIAPYEPIHVSLEGGVGVGSVSWAGESSIGLLPYGAVRLDLNVVSWFRAGIGPSIRGIASSTVPVETSAVTGGVDVVLKFGSF